MSLAIKVNLILVLVFVVALVPAGFVAHRVLRESAREQVLTNARIMMETALAARSYTQHQIKPLLADRLGTEFLPQTVPAYSATEIFAGVRRGNPEYTYKEATLNPSNPRDRTVDWEADVVNAFRADTQRTEIVGERETPDGRSLYLAHPIQIKDKGCLSCHTTPEEAPASLVRRYGPSNGFGWQMGEVIGAQIIQVPMSLPIRNAQAAFWALFGSFALVFVVALVALNALLYATVIRPLRRIEKATSDASLGRGDAPQIVMQGRDEIARLSRAIARMRISLDKALALLEDAPARPEDGYSGRRDA
jgi:HAMP domain-containing protein